MRNVDRHLLAVWIAGLAGFLMTPTPACPEAAIPPHPPRVGSVVYVREGDLYVRDLPDGAARRLTRGGGSERPHWSPSGTWIACFRDTPGYGKRLCLIRRDGTGVRSLPCGDGWQYTYRFSPSGGSIAFVTDDGALITAPLEHGRQRILVPADASQSVVGVDWSPNGRYLAYVTERRSADAGSGRRGYRVCLWQVNADGTGKAHLLYTSHGHQAVPCLCGWSADSRHLLFWALHYFPAGSINWDGLPLYACAVREPGRATRPAHLLFGSTFERMVLSIPDFVRPAPRGGRVAVAVGGDRYAYHNKRIALMDLGTGSERFVTPASQAATCPTWSPDGRQMAYQAGPAADPTPGNAETVDHAVAERRLWTMAADGTHRRRLPSGRTVDDTGPRWLGDGRTLLFEREEEVSARARFSLWTIRSDGSGLRCIVPHIGNDDADEACDDFDVWLPSPS